MVRVKKYEVEKTNTPKISENISDIFEEMNNEAELIKKEKRKYAKKPKNENNSNSSDQNKNENKLNFANLELNAKANANINLNPEQIQVKNKVLTEKLSVVDKFYKKYPHLKKDKTNFIKEVLEEKVQKPPPQPVEYIIEKITLENKVYYRDYYNNVMDQNTKLVGFYQKNGTEYEYILFSE
jgi:hypothetical protein